MQVHLPDVVAFSRNSYCVNKRADAYMLMDHKFQEKSEKELASSRTGRMTIPYQAGFFYSDSGNVRVYLALDHLLFAMLSVTAGQGLVAVLYALLVDAVPGRAIIVGVGLSRWLGGVMGQVANIIIEPITNRLGSGPLVIGFSVLSLIAMICVRSLPRKMPQKLIPP